MLVLVLCEMSAKSNLISASTPRGVSEIFDAFPISSDQALMPSGERTTKLFQSNTFPPALVGSTTFLASQILSPFIQFNHALSSGYVDSNAQGDPVIYLASPISLAQAMPQAIPERLRVEDVRTVALEWL